jgi:outer membrane lipoprotein-sorting protein
MICWRIGALAFLLVASVVACTPRHAAREPIIQPAADTSPEDILALFDQRWRLAESLRAVGRVTVTSAQGRYSTRQTFLWRRPALLRLDTLSLFGQPVMSLVADAGQASIYYPAEGAFFQGPSSAGTLARAVGLPLDAEEVAPLLMGYIRPAPTQQVATIALQADESMLLLRFLDGEGGLIQDAWVDPDRLLARRVLRYTQGNLAMVDLMYSDVRFLAADTFPAPHALTIWLPHAETEVRLQFLTIDFNPALSPAVFHLSPPAGVLIRPLP